VILFLALLVPPAAAAPPVDQPTETRCLYSVTDKDGTRFVDSPPVHVLADTKSHEPYDPPIPAGAAIMCGRSSMVPAEDDWKVLAAGHPLAIADSTPGSNRLAWLEVSGGRFRYRFSEGRLTPDEAAATERRLDAFQKHLQR